MESPVITENKCSEKYSIMEGKVPSILEYVGEIKNTINGECDLRIENAKQSTMEDFRAGMTVN